MIKKLVSALLLTALMLTGCSNASIKTDKASKVAKPSNIYSIAKNIGKLKPKKSDSASTQNQALSSTGTNSAGTRSTNSTSSNKKTAPSVSVPQVKTVVPVSAPTSPVSQLVKPSTQVSNPVPTGTESQSDTLKNQVEQNLKNRISEFTLTYACNYTEAFDVANKIVSQLEVSNPYDIYNVTSYREEAEYISDNSTSITFDVSYRTTAAQEIVVTNSVSNILSNIITPGMTTAQKELAIHDWIVNNTRYDESLTIFDAYHTLTEHTGTCEGYALLAYKMFTMAGIC